MVSTVSQHSGVIAHDGRPHDPPYDLPNERHCFTPRVYGPQRGLQHKSFQRSLQNSPTFALVQSAQIAISQDPRVRTSDVVVCYGVSYIWFMMFCVSQSSVPYSVGFECFLFFIGDVIFTTESTEMFQTFYRHCHFHPLEKLADSSLANDLTNGMSWHMLCIACLLVQSGHSGRWDPSLTCASLAFPHLRSLIGLLDWSGGFLFPSGSLGQSFSCVTLLPDMSPLSD